MAYVGLADAYRAPALRELIRQRHLSKSKAAVKKALEIDDSLADAHAILRIHNILVRVELGSG